MASKRKAWLMAAIFLAGCGTTQPGRVEVSANDSSSQKWLRVEWNLRYTAMTNEFTERTYQCITEMYSLAYHPVESGPVCQESCALLDRVNEMVAQAPPYIVNPQQYALPPSKVCKFWNRKKRPLTAREKGGR